MQNKRKGQSRKNTTLHNIDMQKNSTKGIAGITLIALVVTIVVLLILAGVSINLVIGQNGIISKARDAKLETEQSGLKQEVELKVLERNINKYSSNENEKDLGTYLREIPGAIVEDVNSTDTWYVTRGDGKVTVYEDGDVLEGKIDVWDGTTMESPVFKDFNWYIYNGYQFKFFADFVNLGNDENGEHIWSDEQKAIIEENGYNINDVKINDDTIVYLMSDLDLGARQTNGELTTGTAWTPIGTTKDLKFTGTFEGNNHTIRGVYVNIEENFAGIFGNSDTIQNLTIKNSYIKTSGNCAAGIVAALREGTIVNCNNIDTIIVGKGYVGGVAGQHTGTEFSNCSNSGTVTGQGNYTGGVIGFTGASSTVSNCSNNGAVTGQGNYTGGVVGATGTSSTVSNCSNSGAVTGDGNFVGGIVGIMTETDNVSNSKVEKCYNSGAVEGNYYVGGIVGGVAGSQGTITKCYSKGKIKGTNNVGALIGVQANTTGLNTLNHLYYLNTVGIGAINGEDDISNNITSTTEDIQSFGDFLTWIENQ